MNARQSALGRNVNRARTNQPNEEAPRAALQQVSLPTSADELSEEQLHRIAGGNAWKNLEKNAQFNPA